MHAAKWIGSLLAGVALAAVVGAVLTSEVRCVVLRAANEDA